VATFTAAGKVRRDLQAAGFAVQKMPGYGSKRECIKGALASLQEAPAATVTPWELVADRQPTPSSAIVLGAGLAGCSIADALARRGIAVTLLERNTLASGGSGNEQGVLYTRLSRKHSALTDFALLSFSYAAALYRQYFALSKLLENRDGALCGSFHQRANTQDIQYLKAALADLPELAQIVDAEQASERLGVEQHCEGYWFPESGWLRPAAVCHALIAHPNITLVENAGDVAIPFEQGAWRAQANGRVLAESDCAVIATGDAAKSHPALQWLPSQAIRGQVTRLPALPELSSLASALCHEGYIAPARDGEHCIGATFDLQENSLEVRPEDHRRNIDALARAVPSWRAALSTLEPHDLHGRVAFRCASPDYLPVVGPVPDYAEFLQCFAGLRKNARQTITQKGPCLPGLFVTTCHGSRGLSSAPLSAELLASQICGEAPPLSRELIRALSPSRFLVRDLSRNRQ